MSGFPLTGVDPNDPIPGIVREILFQQGSAAGSSATRDVVLIGQKLTAAVVENSVTLAAAGTETVDTLGTALLDEEDVIARFGFGSEMHLMYRAYTDVDPDATIYGIAPASSGTRATVVFTVGGAATASGTEKISLLGEDVYATVVSGDSATTIAAAIVAKINAQSYWPVSASNTAGAITVTVKFAGGRGDYILTRMRMVGSAAAVPTPSKASVTTGGAVDDVTNAIAALDTSSFYYSVLAQSTTSAATSTDNGVGEYAAFLTQQNAPSVGYEMVMVAGLTGTNAQATTVASSVNNALAKFVWAENNDWPAAMVAAHHCAVIRSKQVGYAAANLTDYGLGGSDIYKIPDPFTKTDRPTKTEIRLALNNGVTPVGFTSRGKSYIVRDITSRCLNGNVYDYRVREGHIPSCIHYFWQTLRARYASEKQQIVANDLVVGEKPTANTTRPLDVKAMIRAVVDQLVDNVGGPILDPSSRDAMKATAEAVALTDGISARCRPIAARHNNKGQFLIEESSTAY